MQNIQAMNSRQDFAVHIVDLREVQPVLVLELVDVLRRVTLRRRVWDGRRKRVQLLHYAHPLAGLVGTLIAILLSILASKLLASMTRKLA